MLDAGASWVFLVTTFEFMGGGLVVALKGAWTRTWSKEWCSTCSGSSAWSVVLDMFWFLGNACGSSMILGSFLTLGNVLVLTGVLSAFNACSM